MGVVLFTLTATLAEFVTLVTCVVAVMVAVVDAGTVGAVNNPASETTPIELVQLTAVVMTPLAEAKHWLVCNDWMMVGVQETEMAVTGVTVMVTEAFLELSWLETAVMVFWVVTVTAWAVKRPLVSMVPALVPYVTPVAKLPLPVTAAVHWLVWPDCTEVGVQANVTAEMEELEPPPPQAEMPSRHARERRRARKRKPVPQETERVQREGCK